MDPRKDDSLESIIREARGLFCGSVVDKAEEDAIEALCVRAEAMMAALKHMAQYVGHPGSALDKVFAVTLELSMTIAAAEGQPTT